MNATVALVESNKTRFRHHVMTGTGPGRVKTPRIYMPASAKIGDRFAATDLAAVGRVRERASRIGAEVALTAALSIAVARGWMSTA